MNTSSVEDPSKEEVFTSCLNPQSLNVLEKCFVEPFCSKAQAFERFQFERLGYFCVDTKDSTEGSLVFNRTVTLRDTWAKILKAQQHKT